MKIIIPLSALLLLFTGCGGGSNDGKIELSGTATWNGKSIERGEITLISPDQNVDAAKINNGKFQIRTQPGEKKVSVLAYREVGQMEDGRGGSTPISHQFIPHDYNRNSELTETIDTSMRQLTIAIDGEEIPTGKAEPPGEKNTPRPRAIAR
ncbi:MAG: hypothetical protein WDZ51_08665 [Pirellulaceae bacterium]